MSTPTPPDRPVEPEAAAPSDATEQLPSEAAAPPSAPPPGPNLPPGPPLPPGYPPPYPFAPTYREPWINPAKRRTAGLAAAAAALVLLGAGFLAGAAAFDGHGGREHRGEFMNGNGPGYGPGMGNGRGQRGMNPNRGPIGQFPGNPGQKVPPINPTALPASPTPAASSHS
jgi:hypothetical protein